MRLSALFFASALFIATTLAPPAHAQTPLRDIDAGVDQVSPQLLVWRRDFHQHPELGNREHRTAARVAALLRSFGLEVRTGVAGTGVIGILSGARPGPVVALRAELDALPVREATGLPYASTAQTTYEGQRTYVAHVCGHDMHAAMLLGAAQVLSRMRERLSGTVVFVFQPAEEGPPSGETGGAERVLAEHGLDNPAPSAIFAVHVVPGIPGAISYRAGGFQAAVDQLTIRLRGRQTHGAWPWQGIDVVSLASTIVSELNRISARTVDVTRAPTVLSITAVNGGSRWNIIPQDLAMQGTLRTFDEAERSAIQQRVQQIVADLAHAYGATAEVEFIGHAPATHNDPELTAWALPAMQEAAGGAKVDAAAAPVMVSDDFSFYGRRIPGLLVHLGASQDGEDPAMSAPNHSPMFNPNERVLPLGVRTYVLFAVRYLERTASLPD